MAADPDALGPAMSALNERQQAFVAIYVANGGKNVTACFRTAGYPLPAGATGGNASKLLHNPKVQAAIREYAAAQNASTLPLRYSALERIAEDPKHPRSYDANIALLGFAGVLVPKAPQVVDMKVTHSLADLRRRAVELLADPLLADVGQAMLIEHQPAEEPEGGRDDA